MEVQINWIKVNTSLHCSSELTEPAGIQKAVEFRDHFRVREGLDKFPNSRSLNRSWGEQTGMCLCEFSNWACWGVWADCRKQPGSLNTALPKYHFQLHCWRQPWARQAAAETQQDITNVLIVPIQSFQDNLSVTSNRRLHYSCIPHQYFRAIRRGWQDSRGCPHSYLVWTN